MLFNSFPFIFVFLPIALVGYYGLNRWATQWQVKIWLVACSLFFYSYWNIKNLPILLLSILANYLVAYTIWQAKQESSKRRCFFLGLGFNLGILSFFKYSGLLLPLGLSFYTLQQVVWLTDNYQGLGEKKSFLDYLLTVSFFPQLISGPMAFYRDLMPQLERPQSPSTQRLFLGCMLFTVGLIKKVLISETFAAWAKLGFGPNISPDFFLAWKSSLSYTFQLYYDFSGYTDMAIGTAYLFNIQLPQNFNSPFRSKSVIEFWTRWHMTLSRFITTYLFTPLVRAMPTMNFTYTMLATFLAMFIAGIWHGNGLTFVIYGSLHGAALVVNHWWKKRKKKLPAWLAWALTFNFINLTFIIFRAPKIEIAWNLINGLVGANGVIFPKIGIKPETLQNLGWKVGTYLYPDDYLLLFMLLGCFWMVFKTSNSLEIEKRLAPNHPWAIIGGIGFAVALFGMNRITEFIYFNF